MNAIQPYSSFQRSSGYAYFIDYSLKNRLIQTLRRLKVMSSNDLTSYRGVTEYHMRVLLTPSNKKFVYKYLLPFVNKEKTVEFYDKISGYCTPQNSIQEQTAYVCRVRLEFSQWLKKFVNDKWISSLYSSN